jgi:hypothetical protein
VWTNLEKEYTSQKAALRLTKQLSFKLAMGPEKDLDRDVRLISLPSWLSWQPTETQPWTNVLAGMLKVELADIYPSTSDFLLLKTGTGKRRSPTTTSVFSST